MRLSFAAIRPHIGPDGRLSGCFSVSARPTMGFSFSIVPNMTRTEMNCWRPNSKRRISGLTGPDRFDAIGPPESCYHLTREIRGFGSYKVDGALAAATPGCLRWKVE